MGVSLTPLGLGAHPHSTWTLTRVSQPLHLANRGGGFKNHYKLFIHSRYFHQPPNINWSWVVGGNWSDLFIYLFHWWILDKVILRASCEDNARSKQIRTDYARLSTKLLYVSPVEVSGLMNSWVSPRLLLKCPLYGLWGWRARWNWRKGLVPHFNVYLDLLKSPT